MSKLIHVATCPDCFKRVKVECSEYSAIKYLKEKGFVSVKKTDLDDLFQSLYDSELPYKVVIKIVTFRDKYLK